MANLWVARNLSFLNELSSGGTEFVGALFEVASLSSLGLLESLNLRFPFAN